MLNVYRLAITNQTIVHLLLVKKQLNLFMTCFKFRHKRTGNMNIKKHRYEIIFWILIISVGAVLFIVSKFMFKNGRYVQVKVDGEVVAVYPLDDDNTYTITGSDGGTNTLVIEDNQAYISEASCPDGLCIKQGKVNRSSESIICLPNKVVIEVIDDYDGDNDSQEDDVDAVAK